MGTEKPVGNARERTMQNSLKDLAIAWVFFFNLVDSLLSLTECVVCVMQQVWDATECFYGIRLFLILYCSIMIVSERKI